MRCERILGSAIYIVRSCCQDFNNVLVHCYNLIALHSHDIATVRSLVGLAARRPKSFHDFNAMIRSRWNRSSASLCCCYQRSRPKVRTTMSMTGQACPTHFEPVDGLFQLLYPLAICRNGTRRRPAMSLLLLLEQVLGGHQLLIQRLDLFLKQDVVLLDPKELRQLLIRQAVVRVQGSIRVEGYCRDVYPAVTASVSVKGPNRKALNDRLLKTHSESSIDTSPFSPSTSPNVPPCTGTRAPSSCSSSSTLCRSSSISSSRCRRSRLSC
jgi:hypothetical protein